MGKKQKTDKDTVIVYWTARTIPERQTYAHMLWGPPTPVIKTMPDGSPFGKDGNYRSCSALVPLLKNMYTFIHPLTHSATVSGDMLSPTIVATLDAWMSRMSALNNRYSLDYDFSWLFFSEEPLTIKVTPPYFHNTSASKTAFISSGVFDISKWFRKITMSYILWEGENTLNITEGDPAFYIEFLTNKKVILKQFECVPELSSISEQVAGVSRFNMSNKTLEYRYDKFIKSNRHKRVLKLIKDNLLE